MARVEPANAAILVALYVEEKKGAVQVRAVRALASDINCGAMWQLEREEKSAASAHVRSWTPAAQSLDPQTAVERDHSR